MHTQDIRKAAQVDQLLAASDFGVKVHLLKHAQRTGLVVRVVPGVYLGATHQRGLLTEAAGWTLKHPGVVVSLLTAAHFHGLVDHSDTTWLQVPKGSSVPRSWRTPVQVKIAVPHFLTDNMGIERVVVHGVVVRITGPDRTVIDLWRCPHIPEVTALEALRRRVRARGFVNYTFYALAKRLRAWHHLDGLIQGLTL